VAARERRASRTSALSPYIGTKGVDLLQRCLRIEWLQRSCGIVPRQRYDCRTASKETKQTRQMPLRCRWCRQQHQQGHHDASLQHHPVSLYPQATQERLAKGAGPGHIHNLWLRCEYRTVRPANALKAAGIEFANGKRLRARLRDAADGPNFWGQLFIDLRASLSLVGLIPVGALPNPPGLDSTRDMDRAFGPRYREEARQRAMQLQPVIAELKGRGLSLAKIASELNKRKVPTPRGGRWDHSSVRNVMQRLAT
jgi:hypothetical protein